MGRKSECISALPLAPLWGSNMWCLFWFNCKSLLQQILHSTKHSPHFKVDFFF